MLKTESQQTLSNPKEITKCVICQNPIIENPLAFSCGHKFCLTCFPIALLSCKLESNRIKKDISYTDWNIKVPCINCSQGFCLEKNLFPINQILHFFNSKNMIKKRKKLAMNVQKSQRLFGVKIVN